jgi:hypothetical protein
VTLAILHFLARPELLLLSRCLLFVGLTFPISSQMP